MATAITSFRGEHGFLSNFDIEPDGTCVEVEFQAFKGASIKEILFVLKSYHEADQVRSSVPSLSKKRGRRVKLCTTRIDWNEKLSIQAMGFFVMKKFFDHPELAERLLATGDAELIEGNNWDDTTWGMVWDGEKWVGENQLGIILTDVRDALR